MFVIISIIIISL